MNSTSFQCHRLLVPCSVLVTAAALGCELPPQEPIEPDLRVVTLLFTGSIRGELYMCD